jgi:hypothetical protein
MALSLIYFFLCEATLAQTVGKRVMGLRVMTRDGRAPSINAISIRTVLRLIDDGPIGLIVMVLSGERRQRIGDLAAGTAVGAAAREVPRPEANALLVAYPVAWLIGAFGFITLAPSTASAADYAAEATRICQIADAQPEPELPGWVPRMEEMYRAHAALKPPAEMTHVHAALLQSDAQMLDAVRKLAAVYPNQKALRRLVPVETKALHDREVMLEQHLPGCA